MSIHDFIFSKRVSHRLYRHLIFWLVFLIYFFYVNLIPGKTGDLMNSKTYLNAFELMIYFPVSVISVYTAIYFLLPRYVLTGRFFSLLAIISGLTLIYFSLAWLLTVLLAGIIYTVPFHQLPVSFRWFLPVRYGIGLPLTSAALTAIIKMMKNWHLEQKQNELLQRQKIDTELLLLKTQFQPHFLYDALQNIYFLIRQKSPESPATLLKLSDLLSYILYENEKDYVPLEKELEMVKTYLGLKKAFNPGGLNIQWNQQVETGYLPVAPLLLLSLIEDCLEKFMQTAEQQLILDLDIKTEKKELYFQVECKSDVENEQENSDPDHTWIKSLKRIKMLYPGSHSFDVYSEDGTTHILLILEMEGITSLIKKEEFVLV